MTAFIQPEDLKTVYEESKTEALIWREDYPAYERLADNDLMPGLDPNLPEVNDGSLAAALYKHPKRIVSNTLSGTAKAIDRDEAWVSELANLVWTKDIIPYANTQAPFLRKWKDAVRKADIYGSVPIITLFVETEGKRHADFIVGQPQDVTLESGKVSDYDSDVMFWDIYYTKLQLQNIIEQAKEENKDKPDSKNDKEYNKWDIPELERILATNGVESRSSQDTPHQINEKGTYPKGFHFTIVVQKGVEAPFSMYYPASDKVVRTWSNPDPTGDMGIHFLYCYQDFINPYGTGIVKLAGGTQNVLDYFRQADVLATQIGIRSPIDVAGDTSDTDIDSLVYEQDALWFSGNAKITRQELADGIYQGLPGRIQMYKTSLNQLIPTGDTSATAAQSGDPTQSKTPAGVKLVAANLSIDDEDFKDNLYMTFEAVAKSMINIHFANMEGKDLLKLSDDEREILIKAGLTFPKNENGEMSNQLDIEWDTVRAQFDFKIDPEVNEDDERKTKLEGLMKVAELVASDPNMEAKLAQSGKKLNQGELFSEIISLTSDNDKIITDISPEEEQAMQEQQVQGDPNAMQGGQSGQGQDPMMAANLAAKQQQMQQSDELHQAKMQKMTAPNDPQGAQMPQGGQQQPSPEEMQANIQGIMQTYNVDETTALTALAAESAGLPIDQIINKLQQEGQQNAS